ncbi:MAG TPA: SOS response-associated peptidase [Saprospiraceae bacterium]|nr:SOS response-associated peptidase [Saprospiraceae bacterium]
MCGRASLTKVEQELEQRFLSTFYSEDLERYNPLPNFNIAPTHMHPVITQHERDRLRLFRWGLIPFWAKDIKIGYKMINARLETIREKKTYSSSLKSKRCIVPFDGFYEWKKSGDHKIPYRIGLKNVDIFTIAGLYDQWISPGGELIHSFTLITHEPNAWMSAIHNRMPALLLPEYERQWLEDDVPAEQLLDLLHPVPDDVMTGYTVSPRVGNVRENNEELIKPYDYGEGI